jgi:organic radical activating enzyme
MIYPVVEKFKSIQGEGLYAGTPMAFIRFVGCSVGKRICLCCDTDYERVLLWRGGGLFSESDLLSWARPYPRVCLTGGEPLDQDLFPLFVDNEHVDIFHIETSGTKPLPSFLVHVPGRSWITVSPKPGYIEEVVMRADEIKVLVPGLGQSLGWPSLSDALRWAEAGKLVYLQPSNERLEVNAWNTQLVLKLIDEYPTLRISTQLHKLLRVP